MVAGGFTMSLSGDSYQKGYESTRCESIGSERIVLISLLAKMPIFGRVFSSDAIANGVRAGTPGRYFP